MQTIEEAWNDDTMGLYCPGSRHEFCWPAVTRSWRAAMEPRAAEFDELQAERRAEAGDGAVTLESLDGAVTELECLFEEFRFEPACERRMAEITDIDAVEMVCSRDDLSPLFIDTIALQQELWAWLESNDDAVRESVAEAWLTDGPPGPIPGLDAKIDSLILRWHTEEETFAEKALRHFTSQQYLAFFARAAARDMDWEPLLAEWSTFATANAAAVSRAYRRSHWGSIPPAWVPHGEEVMTDLFNRHNLRLRVERVIESVEWEHLERFDEDRALVYPAQRRRAVELVREWLHKRIGKLLAAMRELSDGETLRLSALPEVMSALPDLLRRAAAGGRGSPGNGGPTPPGNWSGGRSRAPRFGMR